MNKADIYVNRNMFYSGLIWILSAVALGVYTVLLLTNTTIPGVEDLVSFLTTIEVRYIYLAAFISIFIEGLYFVGSFFPGASLVLLLAIISQTNGPTTLITTVILIFFGWCLSGAINIYAAKIYRSKVVKLQHSEEYSIKDHLWTTWFPAFRSNYEVAQVAEGGKPLQVFISSIKVRFWATLFVGVLAAVIPFFINIQNTTNKESIFAIFIVMTISLWVGISKIIKARS